MKRRTLFSLGLGAFGIAVGQRYIPTVLANPLAESAGMLSGERLPESDVLFEFAAAGDVGTGKRDQYRVASAMTQHWQVSPYALMLLAGDNIYENGEIEKVNQVFERPYAMLLQNDVRFYAVLGNHDVRSHQGKDEIAYPGYNMAARYYTFIRTFARSSVQFLGLDTNQAYLDNAAGKALWQEQLQWLETELMRSPARWKVVFAHHPIYASGAHGSDRNLAKDLSPLFSQYGVQLYINGHEHHYERTEPIDGTTYITTGNGAKLRRVGRSSWTAFASSQLGFTTFSVRANDIVVRAIDTHSAVYDEALIA